MRLHLSTGTAWGAARAADRHRAGNGVLGPLHGLPFSVKDVIQTKGLETAHGSPYDGRQC